MGSCHFCGTAIDSSEKIFRSSVCPSCGKDLKICLNCKFYSPGSHWDCRETINDPVSDKERANFCDSFVLSDTVRKREEDSTAKSRFNALFGNDT